MFLLILILKGNNHEFFKRTLILEKKNITIVRKIKLVLTILILMKPNLILVQINKKYVILKQKKYD